jgi:hypothetical protein
MVIEPAMTYIITVDATELQVLAEGMRKGKPYRDLPRVSEVSQEMEKSLKRAVNTLVDQQELVGE